MPNRERNGELIRPVRVVAPMRVKGCRGMLIVLEIFHGRIDEFFDDSGQAVNLVDKEHVAGLQVGEDAHQITAAVASRQTQNRQH